MWNRINPGIFCEGVQNHERFCYNYLDNTFVSQIGWEHAFSTFAFNHKYTQTNIRDRLKEAIKNMIVKEKWDPEVEEHFKKYGSSLDVNLCEDIEKILKNTKKINKILGKKIIKEIEKQCKEKRQELQKNANKTPKDIDEEVKICREQYTVEELTKQKIIKNAIYKHINMEQLRDDLYGSNIEVICGSCHAFYTYRHSVQRHVDESFLERTYILQVMVKIYFNFNKHQ